MAKKTPKKVATAAGRSYTCETVIYLKKEGEKEVMNNGDIVSQR